MRFNERDFLSQVLEKMEDLPEGFKERLLKVAEQPKDDRADALRQAIEEQSGE
jgi:hypothetical protein